MSETAAPIERRSVVLQVRDRLHNEIVSGRLETDTLYSVATIAEELGVSRTPVREALLQLSQSGLIEFHRNRGFTVVDVTIADLTEIFQVRLAMETAAARRVATSGAAASARSTAGSAADGPTTLRDHFTAMADAAHHQDRDTFMAADRAFHETLLEQAGNRRAQRAVKAARDALYNRGVSASGHDRTWSDLVAEHEAILDAVESGSGKRAAAAMGTHLINTAAALAKLMFEADLPKDWATGWSPNA